MSDPTPPPPPPAPKQAQAAEGGLGNTVKRGFYWLAFWAAFWAVLLAPGVVATIAPFLHSSWEASAQIGGYCFLAGIPAGIVCGVMLARKRRDGYDYTVLTGGLVILSMGLAFGGCAVMNNLF